ncbi:MAG: hypothetical protein QOI81_1762 [Actinomycetota bacterium]|nr:hypothetical protein [Actinomycetota bacterium]
MRTAITDDLDITFDLAATIEPDTTPDPDLSFEPTEASAVRREARIIGQSANRFARGDTPEETENERVLAGMVRHLAGQIERLATLLEVAP